jgi:D-3-phosphoglycerate dehydrogenase
MSAKGIPVFNAPERIPNAVKELVVGGLILACRQICEAWDFRAATSKGSDEEISKAVEAGKKSFAGFELPGRTLGVIGLGAIGPSGREHRIGPGMDVIGIDPGPHRRRGRGSLSLGRSPRTVDGRVLSRGDFLTVHVPLMDATRNLVNADRLEMMKKGAGDSEFAREGIVNDQAIIDADRCRPRARLHQRLPHQPHEEPSPLRHAAASRRVDGRGRGQLRDHGRRPGARLPRERQRQERR